MDTGILCLILNYVHILQRQILIKTALFSFIYFLASILFSMNKALS